MASIVTVNKWKRKRNICQLGLVIGMCSLATTAYSFHWNELWLTQDQQAQRLMQQKQYEQAEARFVRKDWRATAAYRAHHYKQAATDYGTMHNAQGYYNQGNALAHLGQYQAAIQAYDKALKLEPSHQDAIYNRRLLQTLLEQKKQQEKNQQNQEQQNKTEQSKDSSTEEKQNKTQESQNQSNKDQQQQERSEQSENASSTSTKQTEQSDKDQVNPNKDAKMQPNEQQPDISKQTQASAANNEEQQAKERWLRLIPDDPGGLMREKFLRDHRRRHKELDK